MFAIKEVNNVQIVLYKKKEKKIAQQANIIHSILTTPLSLIFHNKNVKINMSLINS